MSVQATLTLRISDMKTEVFLSKKVSLPAVPQQNNLFHLTGFDTPFYVSLVTFSDGGALIIRLQDFPGSPEDVEKFITYGWVQRDTPSFPFWT